MKSKRILKITQLTLSILLVSFVIVVMYFILVIENTPLKYRMLIPLFMIASGIFSIAYQFKTLKYYKDLPVKKAIDNVLFWVCNLLFAIAIIGFSAYLIFTLKNIDFEVVPTEEIIFALTLSFLPFVLGISLLIEEALLYKKLNKSKSEIIIETIDDIKGNKENDAS